MAFALFLWAWGVGRDGLHICMSFDVREISDFSNRSQDRRIRRDPKISLCFDAAVRTPCRYLLRSAREGEIFRRCEILSNDLLVEKTREFQKAPPFSRQGRRLIVAPHTHDPVTGRRVTA